MGVAPVDFGDGRGPVPIDQSNAKQALQKREELGLNTSQIKYAESFLTTEEKDEIFYSENESKTRGENAIGDKEKAESHDGQGGNAAATSVGMAAGAVGLYAVTKAGMKGSSTDGHVAFGFSIAALACSIVTLVMAKLFDNAYADRTSCRDNGDATNETLDGYTSQLEDSMDTMNDDLDEYQDAIDNYTASKNDNTNRQAEVQMQIQDAEAMGDGKKVAELREQLKGLGEADFSKEEEGMGEIKERLDEYGSIADEAGGASGAAETVSEFLKEGMALGIVATIDALLLAVAAAYAGLAVASATVGGTVSNSHLDFVGGAMGYAGAALFGVAAGLAGTAATTMGSKAKNEFECYAKGGEMKDHVDTLNDMIGEQTNYVDQTNEDYGAADDASAESQGEAAKKAGEATQSHAATYKKPEEKDDDKTGAGSGSGGGGGNGNGKNA